jgi:hypothetical protein
VDRINNIQVCPTPVFYQAGHRFVRFVQEPSLGSSGAIISVEILPVDASAVADTANSAGSVVSALYYIPHRELAPIDAAASTGSIVSAANTSSSFQRNTADTAASAGSIVSVFVFTPHTAALADVGTSSASIVSADVMNSAQYQLTSGTLLVTSFAHGLGNVPGTLSCVLLCTSNDAGTTMTVGQEIPTSHITSSTAGGGWFSVLSDATNIYVTYTGNNASSARCYIGQAAARTPTSWSNFAMKIYYQ